MLRACSGVGGVGSVLSFAGTSWWLAARGRAMAVTGILLQWPLPQAVCLSHPHDKAVSEVL